MAFQMPVDPSAAHEWASLSTVKGIPLEDMLVYMAQLHARAEALSSKHQTMEIAQTYLRFVYDKNFDRESRVLFSCVICGNSVVVDHGPIGRRSVCSHIMHTCCMATFETNACPKCSVPFNKPEHSDITREQLAQHIESLAAASIVKSSDEAAKLATIAEIKTGLVDETMDPELYPLHTLVAKDAPMPEIYDKAIAVCQATKARLTQRAHWVVTRQLEASVDMPYPEPPKPRVRTTGTAPTTSTPFKRPRVDNRGPPPPSNLAADEPLEEGTELPKIHGSKSIQIDGLWMTICKWDKGCVGCRRQIKAGQTIVTKKDEKWVCVQCGLGKTSQAVYEEMLEQKEIAEGTAACASSFDNEIDVASAGFM